MNLHAAIEDRENDNRVIPITLLRAARGITTSANLGIGETVSFDGLRCKVTDIIHEHAAPQTPQAPNSHVYVEFPDPMGQDEFDLLLRHGWTADIS